MTIKEYPKIETLYDRNEKFSVDPTKLRKQEFANIRRWHISEKINGTNVRIGLHADGSIEFGGKTNDAQMPVSLINFLRHIPEDRIRSSFKRDDTTGLLPEVVMCGEGYGSNLAHGSGIYHDSVSVCLFDVMIDKWWLSRANVADVAQKVGLITVPEIKVIDYLPEAEEDLKMVLGNEGESVLIRTAGRPAKMAEGIVARTDPMLFFGDGKPVMWKLKFKDFREGKRK